MYRTCNGSNSGFVHLHVFVAISISEGSTSVANTCTYAENSHSGGEGHVDECLTAVRVQPPLLVVSPM